MNTQAYRRLSLLLHPDKNDPADCEPATRATQHLNDAYAAVGTPEQRATFDAGLGNADDEEVQDSHFCYLVYTLFLTLTS